MSPYTSRCHVIHRTGGQVEDSRYAAAGQASDRHLFNPTHNIVRQSSHGVSFAIAKEAHPCCVPLVIGMCNPLQVFSAIVQAATIFMIDLVSCGAMAQKRVSDKSMNRTGIGCTLKSEIDTTGVLLVSMGAEYQASGGAPCGPVSSNAPNRGNAVVSCELRDWSPFLSLQFLFAKGRLLMSHFISLTGEFGQSRLGVLASLRLVTL